MIDRCPTGAVLEAFAAGRLTEDANVSTEKHLACCLGCAEELERLTRDQLQLLVGAPFSVDEWPQVTGPMLDCVIQQAAGIGRDTPLLQKDWLAGLWNPTPLSGAPICFAGYEVLELIGRGGMGVVLKAASDVVRPKARKATSEILAFNGYVGTSDCIQPRPMT